MLVGRNEGRLSRVAEGMSAEVMTVRANVRVEKDMEGMAERALGRFGRIDVLVCSAGLLRPSTANTLKMLTQITAREWDEVLGTNLRGTFLSNRAVLPTMIRQRRGHIINVSSTSGRKGYAFDTAYCASKFGVIGLTEALAAEVAGYGIKVEVLLPGAVATPMWEQNGPFQRPENAIRAESVANAVVDMLSVPDDAYWYAPSIEPFSRPLGASWIGDRISHPLGKGES